MAGGSIAVYGSENLFRVMAVSGFNSASSDHNSYSGYGGLADGNRKGNEFAAILDTEVDKINVSSDINIATSGYTHLGKPSALFITMHDYTYM